MSAQRDELAQSVAVIRNEIWGTGEVGLDNLDYQFVDGLIAAGWAKPRTITTVEELDALQCGVVIREKHYGIVWEKQGDGEGGFIWVMTGSDEAESDPAVTLPATVLYEPTA